MQLQRIFNPRRGGGSVDVGRGRLRRPGWRTAPHAQELHSISRMRLQRHPHTWLVIQGKRPMLALLGITLLTLLLNACSGPFSSSTPASTTTTNGGTSGFPTTGPALRTPPFGTPGQVAPTVKVLASAAPTLIIQFPLDRKSTRLNSSHRL